LYDCSGDLIDYIAWGADAGADDDEAVTRGLWTEGEYIDTAVLVRNETIGRSKHSNDTDTKNDWENTTSGGADPYGVDTPVVTPGSCNIIPEYGNITFALVNVSILIMFVYFKRRQQRKRRK
jgi:hypothetical protein